MILKAFGQCREKCEANLERGTSWWQKAILPYYESSEIHKRVAIIRQKGLTGASGAPCFHAVRVAHGDWGWAACQPGSRGSGWGSVGAGVSWTHKRQRGDSGGPTPGLGLHFLTPSTQTLFCLCLSWHTPTTGELVFLVKSQTKVT